MLCDPVGSTSGAGIVFVAGDDGSARGCTARRNGNARFAGSGAFTNNRAFQNINFGMLATAGSTVMGSQMTGADVGVRCSSCVLRDNHILPRDTGVGFSGTSAPYGGNRISGGTAIAIDASAVQDGVNSCIGAACP